MGESGIVETKVAEKVDQNKASEPTVQIESEGNASQVLKIKQILDCLPHRYPMLLVDRIVNFEAKSSCVGIKNVTINEPFFQGHYPGLPIMPGVLIIESMAQAGAVILLTNSDYEGFVPVIGAIDDVKFRRPVVPGDQLRTKVDLLWIRSGIGRIRCVATVDGEIAASMEMTFKLMPPTQQI